MKACVFAVYLVSDSCPSHHIVIRLTKVPNQRTPKILQSLSSLFFFPNLYSSPPSSPSLVEALTINFHYPELADTGVRIPQFDIEDSIHNLHIGGSKGLGDSTDSARGPDGMKLRTIGEVKRAIKVILSRSIQLKGVSYLYTPTETDQELDHHVSESRRVAM